MSPAPCVLGNSNGPAAGVPWRASHSDRDATAEPDASRSALRPPNSTPVGEVAESMTAALSSVSLNLGQCASIPVNLLVVKVDVRVCLITYIAKEGFQLVRVHQAIAKSLSDLLQRGELVEALPIEP